MINTIDHLFKSLIDQYTFWLVNTPIIHSILTSSTTWNVCEWTQENENYRKLK